jgi:hypothetical protein
MSKEAERWRAIAESIEVSQREADERLLAKYGGRSIAQYVKIRGKDEFRPNPLIEKIHRAKTRLGIAE